MTTAKQIIDQSLGLIGVKAPGQASNGGEAVDCLARLNTMLDGWRAESLYAYTLTRVTGTLAANTATATIGPTPVLPATVDFACSPRPTRIEEGSFFTLSGIDHSISPASADEYNSLSLKVISTQGPIIAYLDATVPQGTIYFYPRAAVSVVVTLLVQKQLSDFADLTTNYDLPQGYKNALVFSFAEDIAPDYEKTPSPYVIRRGMAARRSIKRVNHAVPQLEVRTPTFTDVTGRYL